MDADLHRRRVDSRTAQDEPVTATTQAPRRPDPWPDVLDRGEWLGTLLDGGVWLVFLIWPIVNIITSDAAFGWKAAGLLSIPAFAAIYLASLIAPRPVRSIPRWANTLGYTFVIVLLAGVMSVPAGIAVLQVVPYIVAVWLFSHPIRIGVAVALIVLVTTATVLFTTTDRVVATTFFGYLCIGLVVIFVIRLTAEREESARLLNEHLQLARQREAFARDVHDVLGHTLTVISVKAELAKRLVAIDPDRAVAELTDVQQLARRSLAEVRTTIEGRRTPELGDQLAATTTALEAAGIQADVPDPAAIPPMPRTHQGVLAWCLREAVTNVIRHAAAGRCTITIEPGRLAVIDDGVGPAGHNGEKSLSGGAGLEGMRSRVTELSGTLTVLPEHPARARPGTRVEVRL